ncbi:hypothetical protein SAMN05216188_1348 [Lentzea xinjiangensis]|uniref:PEP-CTERM protein-sorting domain-containing protein n=1 Tax=Lentzea xinjiangensis TaxID=402600 RepID=A0A1H9WH31_9PSEU|nr:hypothetical protein [Lentzea xinjiangensis]SES33155.1 hypothetical protein SAMN05216188_1348 [Lentzea xinjiangensis]
MTVHTSARPVLAPADLAALSTLVAEPESAVADPPLPEPNAAGVLLLGLLLSPSTPKEPRK